MLKILQILFVVLILSFLFIQIRDFVMNREKGDIKQQIIVSLIGFIANFFDALGVGSFAPSTSLYHFTKTVDDEDIPGVLNVSAAVPVMLQGLLFMSSVEVDIFTLISINIMAIIGSFVGVRCNSRLPEKGIKLAVGNVIAFILGVLLPLGVGHYAPMMVALYVLGMSPICAFPIMMTAGGTVTWTAGLQFIRSGKRFNRNAAFGFSVLGAFGVIIAVFLVKSLPVGALQWLVIIVVIYTSITMIYGSVKKTA